MAKVMRKEARQTQRWDLKPTEGPQKGHTECNKPVVSIKSDTSRRFLPWSFKLILEIH